MTRDDINPEVLAFVREPFEDETDTDEIPEPEDMRRTRELWASLAAQRKAMQAQAAPMVKDRLAKKVRVPARPQPPVVVDLYPERRKSSYKHYIEYAMAASIIGALLVYYFLGRPGVAPIVANGDGRVKKTPKTDVIVKKEQTPSTSPKQVAKQEGGVKNLPANKVPGPGPGTPQKEMPPDEKALLLADIAEMNKAFPPAVPMDVAREDVQALLARVARYQQELPDEPSPEMAAFTGRAEPTPANKVKYALYRVKKLGKKPDAASEDVRALRHYVLALPRDLVAQESDLVAFLKAMPPTTPEDAQKLLLVRLAELEQKAPGALKQERGLVLFCVLPPGLREQALYLHENMRQFALTNPALVSQTLKNFLMRSRRPIASDAVGIIIPSVDPIAYNVTTPIGEKNWNALLQGGNAYIPTIAVYNLVVNRNIIAAQNQKLIRDPSIYNLITTAKNSNVYITGFIECQGGNKSLETIRGEIDAWFSEYDNISGIYLANSPGPQQPEYAKTIYEYITKTYGNRVVITSSNQFPAESLIATTGSNLIFFHGSKETAAQFDPPGWTAKYDPKRFGATLNGSQANLAESIELAAQKHLGWIYVSDASGSTLPEFWHNEIALIQQLGFRIMGGEIAVGAPSKAARKQSSKGKK